MKRFSTRASALLAVLAATTFGVVPVSAATRHAAHAHRAHVGNRHLSVRFAGSTERAHGGARPSHLAALVGDRESGLGFYALPRQYRVSGQMRERRGDAIRYAVAAEMGYPYFYGVGEEGYRSRHEMFNPVDGYGTPFFAGYYGSAGDSGDDDHGPFGQPYN